MPSCSETRDNNNDEKQHLVCVTGAGGFVGSWMVKVLLLRGYHVRGTARDPGSQGEVILVPHQPPELVAVFNGCHGVFHIASPVYNDYLDLMVVAVEGTRNVINAAADAGVRRVVFTSSYGAVHMDPNRSPDEVLDESCWSDYEFCKKTGNMYCCWKIMAEQTAKEEAAKKGLELVVVVPSLTIGTALQQNINMTGGRKTFTNSVAGYVDIRDVVRAHILVYEHPDAHGRYLCIGAVVHRADLIQLLRGLFPQCHINAKCKDDGKPMAKSYRFSNQRLRDLGLEFTPLRESLYDTVVSLQQQGHLRLPVVPGPPDRARL